MPGPVAATFTKAAQKASARMANSPVRHTKPQFITRSGKTNARDVAGQTGIPGGPRQKQFPSHPVQVPNSNPSIAAHKLPLHTQIPTTPHTPSMKEVLKSFITNVGMDSLLNAAFMTLAKRKPDRAAMVSSMVELASLASDMHHDKRAGLTMSGSLLGRAPQVANALVDVGINVNDIIRKHKQNKQLGSRGAAPLQNANRPVNVQYNSSQSAKPQGHSLSKQEFRQIIAELSEREAQDAARIVEDLVKNLPDPHF